VGRPGSADERGGADAAAALLFGEATAERPVLAEVLTLIGASDEFLDRWRDPLKASGEQWEERFGFERYAALIRSTAERALDSAGLVEADRVVVTSPNTAVGKRLSALAKGRVSTSGTPVGFLGVADPLVALSAVLDEAAAGETILLISAADGCDALVLRTTEALLDHRQTIPVATAVAAGRPVPYTTYLSWRGILDMEPPRRPEPARPAGPPSARGAGWKFGLVGARCAACGFVHLPPARVCRECGAVDRMEPLTATALTGTVATYTVDRLAYSPAPPVVDVVVDFGAEMGAGRSTFEVADADPSQIDVGTRVRLVFRRLFTAGGVHNYFWKARVSEEQG
ncbi:MAG: zinc ribbon domain-containing protein, partial [Nocardioides sp.]|uniref:zinc ribbon domain-containing protein n=1 Tax=Nocardioides sp. TaxID=35761 RepID=UPI0039E2E778